MACAVSLAILAAPLHTRAQPTEETTTLRSPYLDPATNVAFGFRRESSLVGEIDPCRVGVAGSVVVVADVPESVDLGDDSTAKSLLDKAKAYAFRECNFTEKSTVTIWVYLYYPSLRFRDVAVNGVYMWRLPGLVERPFTLKWYSNNVRRWRDEEERSRRAEEEKRRREAVAAAERQRVAERMHQEIIARTIEGFTLSMGLGEALSVLNVGLRRGDFAELTPESDGVVTIQGVDLAIRFATRFRTATARAVRLGFYGGRLFEVALEPLAGNDVMERALREKYGPPSGQAGCGFVALMGGRTGLEWVDRRTRLTFCGEDPQTELTLGGGIHWRLFYHDRETLAHMERRAGEILQQRREEEEKRRKTLPKGY